MHNNPFIDIDRSILADSGISGAAADNLFTLCDRIGARFAGSDSYRQAAEFMLGKFREYRLDEAKLEPFEFITWRRGAPAELAMTKPIHHLYDCYELPYSAATGPTGIEAEVVDIGSGGRDDIEANRQKINGRLVLTTGTGAHRTDIYAECERLGAAGFILATTVPGAIFASGSVTNGGVGQIPAISLSRESALQIQRSADEGSPRCRLVTHGSAEQATTWNVVGELPGSDFPDEMVIMGGHLDSHEIGPGAFDNAAGAVLVMETARLLAGQQQHLRRTIRFVGFAAEEVGLLGSHYHARKHAAELQKARFMLNCDTPALGSPRGLAFHKCPAAEPYLKKLSRQMESPIVCQNRAHCHSDHYPFILQGLPTAGIGSGKFTAPVQHFVHMAADTPDKISPTDLRDTAAFAARFLLRAANDDQWPDMRRSEAEISEWRSR